MRSTKLDGLSIKKKQAIGFLDGALISVADEMPDAVNEVLDKAGLATADVVTIYYGEDANEAEAETISNDISEKYPNLQVEVVNGDQPHYNYIISIE